jgi:2-keto-4-pentenoate hydratase/2-oxohepta-3-ene-1,7-dioic acid hydratase in catechol pathway
MKFATFQKDGKWALGVHTEKGILDVESAALGKANADTPITVKELIRQGEEGISKITLLIERAGDSNLYLEETGLIFGPCVPEPQKIICVGLNYRKHANEAGMTAPEFPLLFSKFPNALAGHLEKVKLPGTVKQADYEAELAIIIGKEGSNINKEDALTYVFGYACANDLSARDLQFKSSQWLLGKTCDGFCPIGPFLTTADEIPEPNNLDIQTYVNGVARQDSNTSDMIFHCDEIISYISSHMTLFPGDIILTGTPEGVIMGLPDEEKVWLKNGDIVKVEIQGLGSLETRLVR